MNLYAIFSIIRSQLLRALLSFLLFFPDNAFAQPSLNCPSCNAGSVVACSGDQLSSYMDITGESAGASYTVTGDLSNPGVANNFNSFILSDIGTNGVGSVTISVTASNGSINSEVVNINFANVQAAFNQAQSNTSSCYQVSFTNNSSAGNGVSIDQYSWDFGFPGGTSSATNPVVNFPGPGIYQVTLTATDNTLPCSDQQVTNITVTGPEPLVSFEANGFPPDIDDQGDTCIVSFCVSGSNVDYDLSIFDEAWNSYGATNQTFTFTNLDNGSVETLPFNIIYDASETGFSYFTYEITDVYGCAATKTYAVYKSDLQNLQFTCTQQGVENYCVGETITFDNTNWQANPADATYQVQFICESTGEVLYDMTWFDAPPATFTFTPTETSCGCNLDDQFLIRTYSSSPCDPPGLPYTAYFAAGFPVDAEFSTTATPPACLGEQLSFDWIHDNGFISSDPGLCRPQFNWTITNLSNAANIPPLTGDFTAHMEHAFNTAGSYEVQLDVQSGCGTDSYEEIICVYPQITEAALGLTYDFGIPAAACVPLLLQPEILTINNLDCGPPTYTWRLYQLPSLTLLQTNNTLSPDFPINMKGQYRLQLTVEVENCGNVVVEEDFYVGAPPVITVDNTVFNACSSGNFICLDDFFCVDTCYSSLTDFSIRIFEGAVNCNNPVGTTVFNSTVLPQSHLLTQPCTGGCQYSWNLPSSPAPTYTLVITAENGCDEAANACITINFGTPVAANIPDFVCLGENVDLTALNPAANCTWDFWNGSAWIPAGGNITVNGVTILQLACPGNCPLQDTIDVYAPYWLDAFVQSDTLCGGAVAEINLGTSPGTVVVNEYVINGIVQPGNVVTYTSPELLLDASFDIHATDENGCEADTLINVTVENEPVLACGNPTYCESDVNGVFDFSTYLIFEGDYPDDALWSVDGQPVVGSEITVNELLLMFGNPAGAPLILNLEYAFSSMAGCAYADSCSIQIEFQGTVTEDILHHCAGLSLDITQINSGNWDTSSLPASAPNSFDGTVFSWIPSIQDTGTYLLVFNSGCSLTEYPISVHAVSLDLLADDTEICNGSVVNFSTVSNAEITNYQWIYDGVAVQSGLTGSYTGAFVGDATIEVIATDAFGCNDSDQIDVTVEAAPELSCNDILPLYCESSTEVINFSSLLTWEGLYPSDAIWVSCGGAISGNSTDISSLINACGEISSDTTIQLIYTLITDNFCEYTDSCSVSIENEDLELEEMHVCSGSQLLLPGIGNWVAVNTPSSAPADGYYDSYSWIVPQNEAPGEYVIEYSAGCGVTEYHIFIYSTPQPQIVLSDDELCIESQIGVNPIAIVADNIFFEFVGEANVALGSSLTSFEPSFWDISDTSPAEICQYAWNVFQIAPGTELVCNDTSCAAVDIIDVPGLPDAGGELCFEEEFDIVGDFDEFLFNVGALSFNSNPVLIEDLTGNQLYDLEIQYGGNYSCLLDTQGTLFIVEPIDLNIVLESDSCSGEASLFITVNQGDNLNYELIGDAVVNGSSGIQEGMNDLQFNTAISEDTTYPIVVQITNGGCDTVVWQDEVLVYAAPNLEMDVAADSELCAGEEVCLDVVNLGSSTISSVSFDMGNGVVYDFTPQNIEIPCTQYTAVLNEVTYTVTGTVVGQCVTDTEYLDITIQPQDVLVVMQEYDGGFCPGDTIDLAPQSINGSGPFDITYEFIPLINPWYIDETSIIMPEGLSDEMLLITINVDGECGADDDLASLYVKPTPNTQAENTAPCQGELVTFTNTSAPLMGEFYWHIEGDDTTYNSPDFAYVFPDNSNYQVLLTQIIDDQCIGDDTLNLVVNVNPEPEIYTNANCYIETYEEVRVFTSGNYIEYLWELENDLYNTSDQAITFKPGDVSPGDTSITIHLSIVDENGCKGDTSRTLVQCEAPYLFVPNCFTPDYDGINDVFCVEYENISSFELWIFDRWGNEVYYSTDPDKCWTGDFNDGEYFVRDGVYQWKIIYNKQPGAEDKLFKSDEEKWKYPPLTGHVTIIR